MKKNELVLFLRDRVPQSELLAALGDIFRISPDADDPALVVVYTQGFAIGISIPCNGEWKPHEVINALATRLGTAVLLESCGAVEKDTQWFLFTPGGTGPLEVEVVELRHGLDVVVPANRIARATEKLPDNSGTRTRHIHSPAQR